MKNNIKMVLKERGRKCFHRSNQAQNSVHHLFVVKIILKCWVSQRVENLLTALATVTSPRWILPHGIRRKHSLGQKKNKEAIFLLPVVKL